MFERLRPISKEVEQELGSTWREALLQLATLPRQKLLQHVQQLQSASAFYRWPSLDYAAKQLCYLHEHGVQSMNLGGTMGSGKSSVASRVTAITGWKFVDADELHPDGNIEKMRSGVPLDDSDRVIFLSRGQKLLAKSGGMTSCSALTRAHRAILAGQEAKILDIGQASEDPWKADGNLGLVQVMLIKPYARALEELDDSEHGRARPRTFRGQKHFITVTRQSEAAANESGKDGILWAQYKLFEAKPGPPWTYLELHTEAARLGPHRYDAGILAAPLLQLKYAR